MSIRYLVAASQYDPELVLRFFGASEPFAPPQDVYASQNEFSDHINISWRAPDPYVTEYVVYRGSPSNVVATLTASQTSWSDFGANQKIQTYWVQPKWGQVVPASALSRPVMGMRSI
jgi:hypothetical protein